MVLAGLDDGGVPFAAPAIREDRELQERAVLSPSPGAARGAAHVTGAAEADLRWLRHYGFRALAQPTLAGGLSS